MNSIKRSFISVTRRRANSIILLFIVFILANVLLTTLSVTTSLKKTKEGVLSSVSPSVTLEVDYNKVDMDSAPPIITRDQAETIYEKGKDYIKSYDYSLSSYSQSSGNMKSSKLPGSDDLMVSSNGTSDLFLTGTQLPQSAVTEAGEGKLIKGEGFTPEDIQEGTNKVLVSKQFAETNGLDVGSTFKVKVPLNDYSTGEMGKEVSSFEEEVVVAGILEYQAIEEYIAENKESKKPDINKYFTAMLQADSLVMPNEAVKKVIDKQVEGYQNAGIDIKTAIGTELEGLYSISPRYILKDYKDAEALGQVIKEVMPGDEIVAKSTLDSYAQVAKPLESMEGLLDMVFMITVFASIIILSLVLCIFMYLRQKEMGIYLALGERKKNIIGQLLIETILIALIGASLAVITANIFSGMLADSALQTMLTPAQEMTGGTMIIAQTSAAPGLDANQISQQYQGGFNGMTLVIFYGVMLGTIILGQLISTLYLLRLNPKKILM